MRNTQLIKSLAYCLIDNVVYGVRLVIERWHRRKDDSSHLSNRYHVSEMAKVYGRFSRDKEKLSSFLQDYIRCTNKQIVI